MRALFDKISDRLRSFLAQRENAALVVRCRDAEGIAILKILEGIDEESRSELFWTWTGDFQNAREYVSGAVKDFATRHEGVRLAAEVQGVQPAPPRMPPQLLEESLAPAERLRQLLIFSRSLLAAPDDCLAVWVFCPMQISDQLGYASLMYELLAHQYPFPWFHHIRIILKEDTDLPALSHGLQGVPRVDYFAPDLSPEAMDKSLEEEAASEDTPLADRIQAMYISANRDSSFGRFDEALRKHDVVLRYHAAIGNDPMVAMVLNSAGEIHQRLGRDEQAGCCFEAAVEPASRGEHPPIPVLLNTLSNLANLRMRQSRFLEGEVYCDAVEKLATVQRDPQTKLQAIENLGYCQYMSGKTNDAAETWKHGAEIAGRLDHPDMQASMLARLRQCYASTYQAPELLETEAKIAALYASQSSRS